METNMSKIVAIHRTPEENILGPDNEIPPAVGPRQLSVQVNGKITMIVEFVYLVLDSRQGLKGRELKAFLSKFDCLEPHELFEALQVPKDEFLRILNPVVECVGCRRIIECMFHQFQRHGSKTLDPIAISPEGIVRLREDLQPQEVSKLLQKSVSLYDGLLRYKQQRSKQSFRCTIHNLDAYKVTPFSETWTQLWVSMRGPCREKALVIEMADLQATLDVYLKKHKFCHECSAKVETAFHLLFREKNPRKEPGYVEELYAGIKRCLNQHIQLPCKVDFIDTLIRRAEPELVGNGNRQRERHAKTLEIAQEEVLTCIGMCVFERFRRMHNARKEEENAVQVLAVLALHGMYRNFDLAVERKRGISKLEQLEQEISQQERREEQRKEQKRLKKRQKKLEKRSLCSNCKEGGHHKVEAVDVEEEEEEEEEEIQGKQQHSCRSNGGGGGANGSKKAKRKSRCESENNVLEEEEEHADEVDNGDDDDADEEPSIHELELIVAHKQSSKSGNLNRKQVHNNNNNKGKNSGNTCGGGASGGGEGSGGVPTTKSAKRTGTTGKENKNGGKQNPNNQPAEMPCSSCDQKQKPLQSQPISMDCGYVSDQLSLTNCSSTSSSSLEDQLVKTGGEGEAPGEENKSPMSESRSSPLTINSQLSSLTSSPEGSEVACQEGRCNHAVVKGDEEMEDIQEEIGESLPPPPISSSSSSSVPVAGSYIPEEQINEFRTKHRNHNLKEVRAELRKNLQQSFAQFCLKNKNRPLSHLCRTGKCLNVESGEFACFGDCE